VFQHDLWAIFDWLANPNAVYGSRSDDCTPKQRALQIRLAQIIRRLALSAEQIQQLPDNYARAIASKVFATSHNPDKPDTAFLPPELLTGDGPWVLLAGKNGRSAAPVHLRFVDGRSAFFVFMNLPGGQKATLAYLERLREFPNPLMPQPADRNSSAAKNLPRFNPELPQFPVGTQVALAREMLLIDNKGKLSPTRLIESVQIRVYREIPESNPKRLNGFDDLEGKQDVYEFRISRKDLFSGESRGLHAIGRQEEEISPSIIPSNDDEFESPLSKRERLPIMQSCSGCHGHREGHGILSVRAYRHNFILHPVSAILREYQRGQQETAGMSQKWENYSWGLLQGLFERESK
jgi:hypothetical protein